VQFERRTEASAKARLLRPDWPEVGLGAITTQSGVFQPEFVVHSLAESLLAAEIT